MNIGNSVYLDVGIRVGDKVGRGNNCGVDSDVGAEVRIDGEKVVK